MAGPQRHHEARGAEAALRAVVLDQGLLYRVQHSGCRGHILDREQGLAVQRRQEADAGIDRPQRQPAGRIGVQAADHTVQAPQSPSAQPSLVPVQRTSSRSHSSTVRVGASSLTSTTPPRWKKRTGRS
jgi:hypothetical protein